MVTIDNTSVESTINWNKREAINDTLIIENGLHEYNYYFPTGTGSYSIGKTWTTSGLFTGPSSLILDLFNLSGTILGTNITTNFSGGYIHTLSIQNISGTTPLVVTLSSGSGWRTWFLTAPTNSVSLTIPTSGIFILNNPAGYAVNSTNRTIQLQTVIFDQSAAYNVSILGR